MTAPAVPTTRSLLEGTQADAALSAVRAIAADLPIPDAGAPAGPSRGSSGFALFWTAYAEVTGDEDARSTALRHVEAAVEAVAALQGPSPGLFASPVGVGWALGVLEGRLLDEDPGGNDVDTAVLSLVRKEDWAGTFDLVRGLVGWGAYGLSRLPREIGAEIVTLAIRRLRERAVPDGAGVTWPAVSDFPYRETEFPGGFVDLGTAHGVAGTVAFLANAVRGGWTDATPLLAGALAWLRAQDTGRRDGYAYPGRVAVGDGERHDARLGWCYGDAAVATGLVQAGRALGDPALLAEARDVARGCAERADTGVKDAGLCHGTAGLGHVFHRLGRALGDDVLLDLSRTWFDRTLARRVPGTGFGGFTTWVDGSGCYEAWPNLLEGASGVGLALLSAVSGAEPWWDGMLLLDGCGPWR